MQSRRKGEMNNSFLLRIHFSFCPSKTMLSMNATTDSCGGLLLCAISRPVLPSLSVACVSQPIAHPVDTNRPPATVSAKEARVVARGDTLVGGVAIEMTPEMKCWVATQGISQLEQGASNNRAGGRGEEVPTDQRQ
jgi:hypothetical protein